MNGIMNQYAFLCGGLILVGMFSGFTHVVAVSALIPFAAECYFVV